MQTKTHREQGKKWKLPVVVRDSKRGGFYFYEVVGYRAPKKGEFYLSGAVVGVYEAVCDLDDSFIVIRFTDRAKKGRVWTKADS